MDSGMEKLTNPPEHCALAFLINACRFSVQFCAFLLFLIPYLTPAILAAQQNFQWRNFTRIGDGLSSNNVRSLAADSQGQIWLATSAGLSRFDGFWHTLDVPRENVLQVFEDAKGLIWALTDDGIYRGVVDLSLNHIDWEHHYSIEDGLIDSHVLTAIQRSLDETNDNQEDIWIGTRRGVSRFDGESWLPVMNAKDGQLHQGVQTIYEDKSGHLWFGLLQGESAQILSHFDGIQWQVFGVDSGLPNGIVQTIAEDDAGTLWVGTTEGVAVYNGANWEVFTTINSPLIDNNVHVIMRDREGVVWIGTTSGISLFDHGNWHQLTKANGLVSNDVRAIFESGVGEIWVGTADNGVSFSDRSWQPITTNDGLNDNQVITMCTDRNGDVWLGTRDGLNRYTTDGIETVEELRGRETRGIIEDLSVNGRIWVGTDQGFGMLRGTVWQDLRIESETNEIQSIALDLDGDIWVSTGILLPGEPGFLSSLNRYDGAQWNSEQEIFQQIDRTIVVMFVDSRGRIYFGTLGDSNFESGLWVLDVDHLNHLALPASGDIRAIAEVADGMIWIGTEVGVLILDRETLQPVAHLSTDHGLVDNSVQVLYSDQHDRVWIGTSDGVSLFQNGKFERTLTASDGLNSNNISAITEVGETLWFGSADNGGISVFKPEMAPPRTRITSGPTRGEIIGSTGIGFKFEGGDASTPTSDLRYIYQLDDGAPTVTDDSGFDKRVHLSNLDEGFHRLTVRAVDREGNVDSFGAVAEFTVDSTRPRVSILSPKPDAVIRQICLVHGTATDENDFQDYQVQIFFGDEPTGESVLPTPFVSSDPVELDVLFRWNTEALSEGTYTVWLFARDTLNGSFDQQHTDETTVTVQVDNTPPGVNIRSPLPESVISGNTEILLELTDANLSQYTLAYSRFKDTNDADWTLIRDAEPSESGTVIVSWDTSALDGRIYVSAMAQDLASNTSRSDVISYVLENKKARPVVSILKPAGQGNPLSQEVSIVGTVNVGVAESATIEEILLEFRELSAAEEKWMEISSFVARGRRFNAEEIARWNTAEVQDGEYQLRLTAVDNYAYKSEITRDLMLDNTHPVASLTSPHNGVVLGVGVINVTGTAIDENFSQYELKVLHNGSEETIHTSNTPIENGRLALWNTPRLEGEYKLLLIVRDRAGLQSSEELTVNLDAGEVVVRIRSPKTGEFVRDSVRVIGTVHDENFSHYELQFRPVDSSSLAPQGQIPIAEPYERKDNETLAVWVTPLLDEKYQLHLTAFDLSGKQSEHTVEVHIDNLEPQAEISAPSGKQLFSGSVEIIGTAADVHFEEYHLEFRRANRSELWVPILGFASTQPRQDEVLASWDTPPDDEEYEVRLIVMDEAGKSSTESIRIGIDNQSPQVHIDQPVNFQISGEFLGDSVQIIGTARDKNFSHCQLEFRPVASNSASPRGQIAVFGSNQQKTGETLGVWKTPLLDERYELRLVAFDLSGKQSEHRTVIRIDNIEPQADISAPNGTQLLSGIVEIIGTADDVNFQEYQLEYRSVNGPDEWGQILNIPSTGAKSSGILASWDTPQVEDVYDVQLNVTDRSGKSTIASVRVAIDNKPPRVQIDQPVRNQLVSETILIRGIASDKNLTTYSLEFREVKEGATWQGIRQSNNPTDDEAMAEWTPPKVEAEYEIRLMAQDASGRPGTEARVTVIVDRIPPQADILFPTENQQLSQRMEIHGTAHDGHFKEYIIEYSAEKEPNRWLPISKPPRFLNPVIRDTLGVWNASGLSGQFTLRLQVEDNAGHRAVDEVRIFLSPEMQQAFGGIVQSQDGRTRIIFPPNSLPERTVVTINPPVDAQLDGILSMSEVPRTTSLRSVYDFAPMNMRLHHLKPATIEFFVDYAKPVFTDVGRLIIVRRESGVWQPIGGTIDVRRGTISTAVSTLGRYAVTAVPLPTSDVAATITDLTCQPRLFSPNRREATAISFRLNRAINVTVKIYNEAGRLRRLLTDSKQLSAGSHILWWDGADNDRRLVISNFYVVTVDGEGTRATKTVIVKND